MGSEPKACRQCEHDQIEQQELLRAPRQEGSSDRDADGRDGLGLGMVTQEMLEERLLDDLQR
jgi:hypothetical protein